MPDELLTVLGADAEQNDKNAPELSERDLRTLYEALVLARILDEHCELLHDGGKLSFWVPSGVAAAVAAGSALALDDADWLYPSFRSAAAYWLRGGSVEQWVAQMLGSADDSQHGRQVAGHASLPDGRYVSVSGVLANHVQQAAGTALAMRLRGEPAAVLALLGAGSAAQAGFHSALELAARLALPLVLVARTDGHLDLASRAAGYGLGTQRVDGGDVLAVLKAARAARAQAAGGRGAQLVEAIVHEGDAVDPAVRLRPFLEHRGLWDPGRQEDLQQRCHARIAAAIEVAESIGKPPAATMFDDVYADRPWMLQEQAEQLSRELETREENA